jgi:hypothetical protein
MVSFLAWGPGIVFRAARVRAGRQAARAGWR